MGLYRFPVGTISFTKHILNQKCGQEAWKDWWCSKEAECTNSSGRQCIFYGPAEMAMFMAQQGPDPSIETPEGQLQILKLVVNNHLLFKQKPAAAVKLNLKCKAAT